jgi:hypothetical protein
MRGPLSTSGSTASHRPGDAGISIRCPPVSDTGFHIGFNLATQWELRDAHARLVAAGVQIARRQSPMGTDLTSQVKAPGPLLVELGRWPRRVSHAPAA